MRVVPEFTCGVSVLFDFSEKFCCMNFNIRGFVCYELWKIVGRGADSRRCVLILYGKFCLELTLSRIIVLQSLMMVLFRCN